MMISIIIIILKHPKKYDLQYNIKSLKDYHEKCKYIMLFLAIFYKIYE